MLCMYACVCMYLSCDLQAHTHIFLFTRHDCFNSNGIEYRIASQCRQEWESSPLILVSVNVNWIRAISVVWCSTEFAPIPCRAIYIFVWRRMNTALRMIVLAISASNSQLPLIRIPYRFLMSVSLMITSTMVTIETCVSPFSIVLPEFVTTIMMAAVVAATIRTKRGTYSNWSIAWEIVARVKGDRESTHTLLWLINRIVTLNNLWIGRASVCVLPNLRHSIVLSLSPALQLCCPVYIFRII